MELRIMTGINRSIWHTNMIRANVSASVEPFDLSSFNTSPQEIHYFSSYKQHLSLILRWIISPMFHIFPPNTVHQWLLWLITYLCQGDRFLEFVCHPPYLNLHLTVTNAPDNTISNGENNILRSLDVVQEVALPLRIFDVVDVGRRSLLVRQAKVAYRAGGGYGESYRWCDVGTHWYRGTRSKQHTMIWKKQQQEEKENTHTLH